MDAPRRVTRGKPVDRRCSVEGCNRPHDARGFCASHLKRANAGTDLNRPWPSEEAPCSVESCERPRKAKALCAAHYNRLKLGGEIETPIRDRYISETGMCRVPGCDKALAGLGYCRRHYHIVNRYSLSEEQVVAFSVGPCDICGRTDAKMHVDHDHACCSGEKSCGSCVRGFLCSSCNWGLGHFKDSPENLDRAAHYLRVASQG